MKRYLFIFLGGKYLPLACQKSAKEKILVYFYI